MGCDVRSKIKKPKCDGKNNADHIMKKRKYKYNQAIRILEGKKETYPDPSFDPIIGNVYFSFFLFRSFLILDTFSFFLLLFFA